MRERDGGISATPKFLVHPGPNLDEIGPEVVGLSCHDKVVLVQTADLVRVEDDLHVAVWM